MTELFFYPMKGGRWVRYTHHFANVTRPMHHSRGYHQRFQPFADEQDPPARERQGWHGPGHQAHNRAQTQQARAWRRQHPGWRRGDGKVPADMEGNWSAARWNRYMGRAAQNNAEQRRRRDLGISSRRRGRRRG